MGKNTVPLANRTGCRLGRCFEIVLPVRDGRNQLLQEDFVIFNQPLGQLFKQSKLIGIVKQREVCFHPKRRILAFDDIQPQRVEGGDHQPTRLFATQRLPDTLFHLARRLIGKGHRRDMSRLITATADQMGDFIGDHTSFTGTRARQHQAGAGNEFDSLLLAGV